MEPQNFIFFNYLNFQKVRKKFLDSKSLAEVVEELFNLKLVIKLWNSIPFYNLIIPERIWTNIFILAFDFKTLFSNRGVWIEQVDKWLVFSY